MIPPRHYQMARALAFLSIQVIYVQLNTSRGYKYLSEHSVSSNKAQGPQRGFPITIVKYDPLMVLLNDNSWICGNSCMYSGLLNAQQVNNIAQQLENPCNSCPLIDSKEYSYWIDLFDEVVLIYYISSVGGKGREMIFSFFQYAETTLLP